MQQRLFEITYLLCEHGRLTAGELAERFGVSRRTIYRDIDALSAAGIPVYAEKGRGGGLRILPDYVLDRTLFTQAEQDQLMHGFTSLVSLQTPDTAGLYDKLAALFGPRDSWLQIDFAQWNQGEEGREVFRLARGAILTHRVISFEYSAGNGRVTRRSAEPVKVIFRNQAWYIFAYCLLRNDWRFFKLSRMQNVELCGDAAPGRPVPPIPEAPKPQGPFMDVLLHFEERAGYLVFDDFPPDRIEPHPNGGYLVRTTLPDQDAWTFSYLLAYGDLVEVLEPPALREKLKKTLENLSKKYE